MSSLQNTTQLGLDDSLIPQDAPSALLEVARLSLAARFTHLACGSVFVYDTFVVFKEEYRLICTFFICQYDIEDLNTVIADMNCYFLQGSLNLRSSKFAQSPRESLDCSTQL